MQVCYIISQGIHTEQLEITPKQTFGFQSKYVIMILRI